MSEKPLPFSNGLNLKVMGAVLALILGVLIWRLTTAENTTQRVLYIVAMVVEVAFLIGLVFASRYIKRTHDRAQAAYKAQIAEQMAAAEQAKADRAPADGANADGAAPSQPGTGETGAQ